MAGKKTQAHLTPEEKLQQALVPEAEQPYKVPANWCWTYLKNVSDCLDNFRKPINANERNARLGDVPYYGATGQVGWIDDYLTNEELVLLGEDGAPFLDLLKNKAYLINGKAWVNNHAHILRSKFGTMGNRLLIEYLNSFDFTGFVTGTTRLKLTQASMNKIIIPLVPLAEQQRIVERIESLFAKLDEAKENLQNVLDGFETRKAAILHKAFTGELTAKWRKQHVVSMESWGSVKVSNLCENIVCGKTPTSYIDNNGDIPYLKVYNIVNNKIDFDSKPQYIPKKIHESKLKSSILKPKDVIMNIVGPPLRKIAIIPDTYPEWNMNQAIVRFRTKEKLYYKYLYYYLIYPKTLDDIICETKGVVGQANISITQSRNLNINLPTFSEQTEIVRIIDELFVKEQQAKELAENALSKVDLIKKTILSRAFRGELGTNNPADEPAIELLKRVL